MSLMGEAIERGVSLGLICPAQKLVIPERMDRNWEWTLMGGEGIHGEFYYIPKQDAVWARFLDERKRIQGLMPFGWSGAHRIKDGVTIQKDDLRVPNHNNKFKGNPPKAVFGPMCLGSLAGEVDVYLPKRSWRVDDLTSPTLVVSISRTIRYSVDREMVAYWSNYLRRDRGKLPEFFVVQVLSAIEERSYRRAFDPRRKLDINENVNGEGSLDRSKGFSTEKEGFIRV